MVLNDVLLSPGVGAWIRLVGDDHPGVHGWVVHLDGGCGWDGPDSCVSEQKVSSLRDDVLQHPVSVVVDLGSAGGAIMVLEQGKKSPCMGHVYHTLGGQLQALLQPGHAGGDLLGPGGLVQLGLLPVLVQRHLRLFSVRGLAKTVQ